MAYFFIALVVCTIVVFYIDHKKKQQANAEAAQRKLDHIHVDMVAKPERTPDWAWPEKGKHAYVDTDN